MKKVLPIHRVAATLLPGVAFVLLLGSAARLHAQECLTFRTQKCPRKAGIKAWGGAGRDPLRRRSEPPVPPPTAVLDGGGRRGGRGRGGGRADRHQALDLAVAPRGP